MSKFSVQNPVRLGNLTYRAWALKNPYKKWKAK